ncbi:MAG: transglycosylase SLT domain-containing protein, partial [Gammaproteobacteria bacterium]|nr:transglycosylase SLT domain-containing protein [Gammaproteobacteria bacterium]
IIQLNARQRLIAAGIATDWGWTSQSIQAISTTDNLHYLSLRYPRGYQKEISSHANSNNIDQEFVFALVRQESLFRPDAYSPAGAIGMMQLLPATAKEVAKSFNIPYEGKHELLQADKNIQLGTSYLKQLLSTFDNNKVFATAAYNAGPHRVVKWIPETPLPADVWIETIPFKETRNYVKHILSSEEIYRQNNWKNNSLLLAKTSNNSN